MDRYYTYLHYGADNIPIYVGKGTSDRAYNKRDYGEPYTVKIVHDNIPEAQALEFEEFLIQEIGIDNLYNKLRKGGISPHSYHIDYDNAKQEFKRIKSLSVKEIRKYIILLVDDVIAGNDKAIRFFLQRCPKDVLFKIKELVQKNNG